MDMIDGPGMLRGYGEGLHGPRLLATWYRNGNRGWRRLAEIKINCSVAWRCLLGVGQTSAS